MKTGSKVAELQQVQRRAGNPMVPSGGKELPPGKGATDRHRIKDYKTIVQRREDE